MRKLFYLAAIVFLATAGTYAQSAKFGHINSAELLQQMPATKAADSSLQKYARELDGQYKTMVTEYQTKLQSFQNGSELMADAVKQSKIKELTDLETRIQDFQDTAQESVQKKKQELYSPIIDSAEKAIKDIAREKNYSYILDTSTGTVLFAQESDDITKIVKDKLGLK
jgi:outer membrane protein